MYENNMLKIVFCLNLQVKNTYCNMYEMLGSAHFKL